MVLNNTKEGWKMRTVAVKMRMNFWHGLRPKTNQRFIRMREMRKWGGIKGVNSECLVRLSVLLTLSPQPCPGMRCLLCPPLLGWLCSWRSLLISSCPTESREWESKTLRHASHSSHCRHLSASTRPEHVCEDRKKTDKERGTKKTC